MYNLSSKSNIDCNKILEWAKSKNEDPFILILDGIEDPHNLGSIIRTAETAGVHGIIIPKRRACGVNSTVSKVSAGAVQHMKIARVNNINEITLTNLENGEVTLEQLNEIYNKMGFVFVANKGRFTKIRKEIKH